MSDHSFFTRASGPTGNLVDMPALQEIALRTTLASAYIGLRATGRVLGALQTLTR